MSGPDDLARSLAELTGELLSPRAGASTTDLVVQRAVALVPGADLASLTVADRRGRQLRTEAATHPSATWCDELQYARGAGPCVEALSGPTVRESTDVTAETRWAGWGQEVAATTKVRSVLSLGMGDRERPLAALNLYSTRPAALTGPDTREVAPLVARHSAAALAAFGHVAGLQAALRSRHEIGVAQGILMERFGLTVDGAFQVLQRYSSNSNVKLREVAAEIVATRSLPTDKEQP